MLFSLLKWTAYPMWLYNYKLDYLLQNWYATNCIKDCSIIMHRVRHQTIYMCIFLQFHPNFYFWPMYCLSIKTNMFLHIDKSCKLNNILPSEIVYIIYYFPLQLDQFLSIVPGAGVIYSLLFKYTQQHTACFTENNNWALHILRPTLVATVPMLSQIAWSLNLTKL
jgi:hypothetical protein